MQTELQNGTQCILELTNTVVTTRKLISYVAAAVVGPHIIVTVVCTLVGAIRSTFINICKGYQKKTKKSKGKLCRNPKACCGMHGLVANVYVLKIIL